MTDALNQYISKSFSSMQQALSAFIADERSITTLEFIARDIAACFTGGGTVISCGNGGSACEAAHIAEEFAGRYRDHRKALPAMSLTEPSWLTCVANDYGYENVFSRGVEAFGKADDILIGFSTSGRSPNVVKAVEQARKQGLRVVLFLGRDGGVLKGKGDREIIVDALTTDRIQEIHMVCIHILIETVERILFPENYQSLSSG